MENLPGLLIFLKALSLVPQTCGEVLNLKKFPQLLLFLAQKSLLQRSLAVSANIEILIFKITE